MTKQKIKIGDNVKIVAGKHKGQTGKIKKIILKTNGVIIENINFKTKHIKPKQNEEKGTIEKILSPINISNIKIQIIQ